ncbi:hypothetical protein G7A66_05815 [Altererythrobacter sp. SALINAS58]|uniref:DoxX family protein n=1 Tax=Alteripontixanthobacter muriae TaxID=2705546 RepID=UPI001574F68C|nr:DoxX family protein [Alteripontixanthobacter muriae]NTZ42608.1 hypothetical protein [Alteripontixanthobacter muriae]
MTFPGKTITRLALAAAYGFAGFLHITSPAPFLSIMPPFVPLPELVVLLTGVAEMLGALALVQPISAELRRAGAVGLALYAVCVFPANINHFILDLGRENGGLGLVYHIPRMFAQPVIIWLTLWCASIIDWPLRHNKLRSRRK